MDAVHRIPVGNRFISLHDSVFMRDAIAGLDTGSEDFIPVYSTSCKCKRCHSILEKLQFQDVDVLEAALQSIKPVTCVG